MENVTVVRGLKWRLCWTLIYNSAFTKRACVVVINIYGLYNAEG